MDNLRPYLLIGYIIISILMFKPIDRFIKGNQSTNDHYAFIRWMLIAFALVLGLLFSFLVNDFMVTGYQKRMDDAYFVLILIGIYLIILSWLRYMYRVYYTKDKRGFRYRGFFKKRDVSFDEISQVKYTKGGRGSSTFRLLDVYGEKYTIPLNFFSVQLLVNYIFLNTSLNIYEHENVWIPLHKKRQPLQ